MAFGTRLCDDESLLAALSLTRLGEGPPVVDVVVVVVVVVEVPPGCASSLRLRSSTSRARSSFC